MHRFVFIVATSVALAGCDPARGVDDDSFAGPFVVDTLNTYGLIDGPANRVFGFVEDAALGEDSVLYVLDRGLKHVRVMDRGLRHVFDFTRSGPGPSELQAPIGIAAMSANHVVVGDRGNTFKIFRVTADTATLESSFMLETKVDDFCVLDDELFVRGWNESALIHRVSGTGEVLGSFGAGWESDSYLTRQERSEGIIGCNDEAGIVAAMFDLDPRIYAYTPEGELLWTTSIPDYHQARIEEGADAAGRPTIKFYDDPPHDMAAKIVPFGSDQFLVQVGLITTREGEHSTVFRLYLISTTDGTIRPAASHVPLLLTASAPTAFTADIIPFPRLVLLQLTERTR